MQSDDYYSTLGVLPDADDVVIKAAYRALAQRYHPDKWTGDADEANRRMAALNKAYEVLGNKQSRADYDKSRENTGRAEFGSKESEGQDEAFNSALNEIEERWAIAVEVFPDLNEYRGRLAKISTALAFDFVMLLLESKNFKIRVAIFHQLERKFLIRYFGENEALINFAKEIISSGQKSAARKLNQLVDVLGHDIDPKLIIASVEALPELAAFRRKRRDEAETAERESYEREAKLRKEKQEVEAAALAKREERQREYEILLYEERRNSQKRMVLAAVKASAPSIDICVVLSIVVAFLAICVTVNLKYSDGMIFMITAVGLLAVWISFIIFSLTVRFFARIRAQRQFPGAMMEIISKAEELSRAMLRNLKRKYRFFRYAFFTHALCWVAIISSMVLESNKFLDVPAALVTAAILTMLGSALLYIILLGSLVAEANKSVVQWVGGTIIFNYIGFIVSFFKMRSLAQEKGWRD